jgi:hypothetical protein
MSAAIAAQGTNDQEKFWNIMIYYIKMKDLLIRAG